jgi:uncharacterized surface protein with fasciclin (FAS1) repeats
VCAALALVLFAVAACSDESSPSAGTGTTTPAATTTIDPTRPDGETQARVHVVLTDQGAPATDLFVDGDLAVNGGQDQVDIPVGFVTAYLYLAPGTHEVALAPTGDGVDQALVEPVDVPTVAGHRYLVAYMGQLADQSLEPLVIDETEAAAEVGAEPTDAVVLTLNNLIGSTGLDNEWAGEVRSHAVFGSYGTGIHPAGGGHLTVTARGATDTVVLDEDEEYVIPASSSVSGFYGPDYRAEGGRAVVDDQGYTSELSVLDLLRAYGPAHEAAPHPEVPSMDTVAAAIETAGLTELYEGGPLLFLPPTDQAFADMPDAERTALLDDPDALANMLRAHTIDAYVPRGSLAPTPGQPAERTFTNLLGDPITITDGYTVNGGPAGFSSTWLSNGTQVHPVSAVNIPPGQ